MPSGLPAVTGDVLTAANYNSLVAFTVGTANTTDYTAVLSDAYQVLEVMNKATAIAFKIPTNASVAFPYWHSHHSPQHWRGSLHDQRSHIWHNHNPFCWGNSRSSNPCTVQERSLH